MNASASAHHEASLGVAEIDASHAHLLAALDALARAGDLDFQDSFATAVACLEADFRDEESRMEEIAFPGLQAHRAQHCRVLGGLHEAQLAVMAGDVDAGRRAIRLLPQWMRFHIWTMDSALSAAILQASDAQAGRMHAPVSAAKAALIARMQVMRLQLVKRIHEQLCLAEERAVRTDHGGDVALMTDAADELATAMLERDLSSLAEAEAALRSACA